MTRTILRGPAAIIYGSQTFYTEGPITVTVGFETTPVNCSAYGKVDERANNVVAEVTATPIGVWGGAKATFFSRAALLWPFISVNGSTAPAIGTGLFSATQAAEKTLVIHTLAGVTHTFQSAAIKSMPSINCSTGKLISGPVTWVCIRELATSTNLVQAWSTSESIYATASSSFTDATFDTTDALFDSYSAVWGSVTGFTTLNDTIDGFTIDFNTAMEPVATDTYGIVDYTIGATDVTCKFRPLNVTGAQMIDAMKIQGSGSARGMSLNGIQSNSTLTISGSATDRPKFTIPGAQLKTSAMEFDMTSPNCGVLEFINTRTVSSGAIGNVCTITNVS